MRAMSEAAVKAGLIDGSKTSQEREAALFKLMEQGKLISSDILPHFGKELSNLANNGGELTEYLEKGLIPQLGRARNNLVDLQNEMAKGMRPATVNLLDGFNDLSKEGGNLAFFLGKVLGGAMVSLGLIIRLPVAAFMDLSYWISDTLGLSKEQTDAFIGLAGPALGVALSIWAIRKAVLKLAEAYGVYKAAKVALGALVGEDDGNKGKTTGGKQDKTSKSSKYRWNRPSPSEKPSLLSKGKGLLGKGLGSVAGPLALYEATTTAAERLSSTNERNDAIVKYLMERQKVGGAIDLNINVNPNGLDDVIDVRVDKAQGNLLENAYMNIQSGSVK